MIKSFENEFMNVCMDLQKFNGSGGKRKKQIFRMIREDENKF